MTTTDLRPVAPTLQVPPPPAVRVRGLRPTGELLEAVGLQGSAGTRIARLSGGQRRRLAVALGVQGRPELVFLDEPTTGMDPVARRQFWQLVRDLRADGTTVLRGETVLAPPVASRLLSRMRAPAPEAPTPRELEVLAGVARGLTNAQIGRELLIGEATVKTHLLRVLAKLGVYDRTRAVVVATERGLLRQG